MQATLGPSIMDVVSLFLSTVFATVAGFGAKNTANTKKCHPKRRFGGGFNAQSFKLEMSQTDSYGPSPLQSRSC